MKYSRKLILFIVILITSLTASGCATVRHHVPLNLVDKAKISDMPEARVISGESHTMMQENLLLSIKQEKEGDFPAGPDGVKVYPVLAISGGGANGAYGAGLLNGWSKEGSRPEFKVITGVSTGALIAAFVFLGKDYDAELARCYTTMSTKDVMSAKGPLAPIFGDSLASNKPLAKTIAAIVDENLLIKVAAKHETGRRLFVGTANLDAQRFVIWDMGAIALRGDLELFRKVILASAAIPVIFPPSIFQVVADGKAYDEIHADGGTMTQVFTAYSLLHGMENAVKALGIDPSKVRSKLYMIRNGYMSPVYKKVQDTLPSLAERSFDTIINSQGIGDAYRIYVFMKKRGNDYNLAYIPSDFKQDPKEMFDPVDMKRLYDRGYADAVNGYKWHNAPPGLEVNPGEAVNSQDQEAVK
jgi:Predicted esterase of the alpha-beta hydrolase superfamily